MPADPIHLAQRIQVDDTLATVRYIGPVPPTPGEWLGVEWDNPLRGKHDGFHNGVRYFHCSVPNSGSFIRPNPAKIFTGRPFLAALVERYMPSLPNAAKDDAGGYSAEQDVGIIHFGGDRSIEVEIVGFEKIERKQKHLDQLQEVGLAQTQISSAGTPGEIKRIAPHIHDLDLSKNLITDWSVIAQIISQLHELEVLRLKYAIFDRSVLVFYFRVCGEAYVVFISPSHTRVTPHSHTRFDPLPTPLPLGLEHAFTSLRSLALNYTRISWREIQHFEPALPLLENLQLAGNGIRELSGGEAEGEETVHGFKNLKWLNLEENVIEAWGEVARLRELE
ncbi:CAP Gly-rich domain-containing protein, partial [Jimgerdemannia flammicorona]